MCVRCLRCVMSFCAPSFPTSSEVVKKTTIRVCSHYRHLGLSVGAALLLKNGMFIEKKVKEEKKKPAKKV